MSDWKPMSTAPRDGTPIEIRCTYGIAPWYGLFIWGDDADYPGYPRWMKVGDESSGIQEGSAFQWREYSGNPAQYVDPTHGAQETKEYWQAASRCARSRV
jgi:hypothetical protein